MTGVRNFTVQWFCNHPGQPNFELMRYYLSDPTASVWLTGIEYTVAWSFIEAEHGYASTLPMPDDYYPNKSTINKAKTSNSKKSQGNRYVSLVAIRSMYSLVKQNPMRQTSKKSVQLNAVLHSSHLTLADKPVGSGFILLFSKTALSDADLIGIDCH